MGKVKRAEKNASSDSSRDPVKAQLNEPTKKKAKHKHKKHRKKKERSPSTCGEEIDVVGLDTRHDDARPLKLKIKFGGQTFGTAKVVSVAKVKQENVDVDEVEEYDTVDIDEYADLETKEVSFDDAEDQLSDTNNDSLPSTAMEPGPSLAGVQGVKLRVKNSEDEEENWLNALESGNLDDFGCLKKSKKVATMTARQRSLYGHEVCGENELLELPLFTKKRDEDAEEVERRRKQRAKKRKQQMQQQIEENKTQTINKLLTKQPTKAKKDDKSSRRRLPLGLAHVRYTDNADGITLSLTEGVELPLKTGPPISVPDPQFCSVDGCRNIKKYACAATKRPLCSLACYKRAQEVSTCS